eukprot:4994574-Pyramimonas_sp.AAC.1
MIVVVVVVVAVVVVVVVVELSFQKDIYCWSPLAGAYCFLNQSVPLDARTRFFDRERLGAQTVPLAPRITTTSAPAIGAPVCDFFAMYSGPPLPSETSLQFTQEGRSRLRRPRN